jgi:xylan 1,4-beta-xylosidase
VSGFQNPVLPGFFPDPSICRVGDGYFLVTSTFTYFPGVPIFRSRNLVDWTQIGNVLDRRIQLDLRSTQGNTSLGVFAPTLRHHDGRFWMVTTVRTHDGLRNFYVTSEDPAGPWSDPIEVDVVGIDPDLAWDDDGNCWLHTALGAISRCRIDDQTGEVLDGPVMTWSGTGLQYPEAPHLLRRGEHWYLLIAEGGTERGHAVSIARGPAPTGPWESCPHNPIVSHRSTERPIQNTGHADLVEAPDGSWWMVLLGTRPRGTTPHFQVLGRETFLAPVDWVDDGPVVGDIALEMERSPAGATAAASGVFRDEFATPTFAPRWLAVRAPREKRASLSAHPGCLTLHGGATLEEAEPAFLGVRQQHHDCRVRARVELVTADAAGLSVWMDDRAHYDVALQRRRVVVTARIGPLVQEVGSVALAAPGDPVVLTVACENDPRGSEPDLVSLGDEDDAGLSTTIVTLPGRYLSTEVAGGFTGRIIAMFAVGGDASFDWFEYQPT